ncbi:putative proteasome endopeptidase complex [Helianthus anomalus]
MYNHLSFTILGKHYVQVFTSWFPIKNLLCTERAHIQIAKITEEGSTVSQPYSLKTFWNSAVFRIQQSVPWDQGSIFDLVLIYLSLCLNLRVGSNCKNTI